MSIIAATRAPVHAPVPGSGIATRIISPQNSYLRTTSLFLSAFRSIICTILLSLSDFFRIQENISLVKTTRKGTGSRLPSTAINVACQIGSPAIPAPYGIAPRSSITGTIAITNVLSIYPSFLTIVIYLKIVFLKSIDY